MTQIQALEPFYYFSWQTCHFVYSRCCNYRKFDCGLLLLARLQAMNSLNSFMAKSLPTYENLFKAEHSDNQALVLFENYLCYRALLDVLSMRASRWEHLVKRKCGLRF